VRPGICGDALDLGEQDPYRLDEPHQIVRPRQQRIGILEEDGAPRKSS
jgi:hypothetical protein